MANQFAGRFYDALFNSSSKLLKNTQFFVTTDEDGLNLATTYTDRTKTTIANPILVSDAYGMAEFYADPGTYYIKVGSVSRKETVYEDIADTADVAGVSEAVSTLTAVVTAHSIDTTNVHGISDTSLLETVSGAQAKASEAQTNAQIYTDAQLTGLSFKAPVLAVTTTNVNVASPGSSFDTVTATIPGSDSFLLAGQTAGAENGIWTWNGSTSSMTRRVDANTSGKVKPGMLVVVSGGSAENADKIWELQTEGPIVLGTTVLTFALASGSTTGLATTAALASEVTRATNRENTIDAVAARKLVTTDVKTADYVAAAWELVICDPTASAFNVTLPGGAITGQTVAVRRKAPTSGTNVITVLRSDSDTIGSATSATITLDNEVLWFTKDSGTSWNVSAGQKSLSSLDARYVRVGFESQPLPVWTTNTAYKAGKTVIAPDKSIVAAAADFTSTSTYSRTDWVPLQGTDALNIRDFGGIGNNSADDTGGLSALLTAAQAYGAYSGGRVPPMMLAPGYYKRTTPMQMFDGFQLIAEGHSFHSTSTIIENHFSNMFTWPSANQVKNFMLQGIKFFGEPSLSSGTSYTVYSSSTAILNSTTTFEDPSASFDSTWKGRSVVATGIPAATMIASVTDSTHVVLTKAATTTASGVSVVIGQRLGGPFSYSLFDPSVYNTKTLWFPTIRDVSLEYMKTVKINLLGGEIFSGNSQLLHFDDIAVQLKGYDYNLSPYGPFYLGQDASAAGKPIIKLEAGSNIHVGDIFPTANVAQTRILECNGIEGLYVSGSRLDGYDTANASSYPITGAAAYFDACDGVWIEGVRVQGAMGGPALNGVSPTDPGALTFNNCSHVHVSAAYRRLKAGNPTIARTGTFSDFNVDGCTYSTEDGIGVWKDNGTLTTSPTAAIWDEHVAGTPGPVAFKPPVVWNSATTYSSTVPADSVIRSGSTYYSKTSVNLNHDPAIDDGTNWALIAAAGSSSVNYLSIFGDGSDGAVVLDGTATVAGFSKSGSTYTQTTDIHSTAFTLNSGVILKPQGYAIYCQGTFTNNGTIDNSGGAGTSLGVAGSAGIGGTTYGAGGSGGAGNVGTGTVGNGGAMGGGAGGLGGSSGASGGNNAGGAGGSVTTTAALLARLRTPFSALVSAVIANGTTRGIGGGAAGGGGGGDATNKGGGGGGGAGAFVLFSRNIVNAGTISMNGGAGGTPVTGNAGGGGGGGGGFVGLYSTAALTGAGTITVTGGTGGTGVGTGGTGVTGTVGTIRQVVLV